jgi:uncharacterized protein
MLKPTNAQRLDLRQEPRSEFPVMKHKWRDILFLHWEADVLFLQRTLPEGLYVDTFDNKAYVGITAFFLYDVHPILLPSIPAISDFKEVNVRTYVHDSNGVPGIWFYSLDANQRIAVQLAKQLHLPYYYSNITALKDPATREIFFRAEREKESIDKGSIFRYKARGSEYFAQADSLEFFLIERYLLYTFNRNKNQLITERIYHRPYPLYEVEVKQWDARLFSLDKLGEEQDPPVHIAFSSGVDVDFYFFKGLF